MDVRSLKFVATACAGELCGGTGAESVRRVCTDSRQTQAGDLFFAIEGDRFDGHDFVAEVARKGAAAVVIERRKELVAPPSCAAVLVDDTRRALGLMAAAYRKDFSPAMVAVGGSNGKTTTKDLIAAVLARKLTTLRSDASFNNDVGVPLTLLGLESPHQAAVLEVGTNHPGELAPLVRMIEPRFGVITHIGREHLEFFGDVAGVAEEEGCLAEMLPPEGRMFINGDNEWTDRIAQRTRACVVRVGLGERNGWRARNVRPDTRGVTFRADAPQADYGGEYRIQLVGRHQVTNALLAMAVGAELGVNREEIAKGLAECKPARMRLQLSEHRGVRVLDDAYNANADSMLTALQVLTDLPCKGRRVAVLGDMAELGATSEAAHAEVGRRAAELGVGQLFAVGRMAPVLARAARDAGLGRVMEFADVDTAAAALKAFLKTGDVVLLKASRAARLERITEALKAGNGTRKT